MAFSYNHKGILILTSLTLLLFKELFLSFQSLHLTEPHKFGIPCFQLHYMNQSNWNPTKGTDNKCFYTTWRCFYEVVALIYGARSCTRLEHGSPDPTFPKNLI